MGEMGAVGQGGLRGSVGSPPTRPDDLLDFDAGDVNFLREIPQRHRGVLVGQRVDVHFAACRGRHGAAPNGARGDSGVTWGHTGSRGVTGGSQWGHGGVIWGDMG